MRVVKQNSTLQMSNFDKYLGSGQIKSKHGELLPNSIRCLIIGTSGGGKTNTLFNLIFDPNGLVFENIYVFSKSLNQPKYQFLAKVLPKEIKYFPCGDNDCLIHPNEAKPNSIMILDDVSCERHNNIRNYFTMGRHNKIDVFYLAQTYSRIPKQLIRDNANLLVIFRQDDMNLRHIYNDHVNTDIKFYTFKNICSEAWKDKYGFVVVNKDCEINKGRYRIGFDQFITDFHDGKSVCLQ